MLANITCPDLKALFIRNININIFIFAEPKEKYNNNKTLYEKSLGSFFFSSFLELFFC